MRAKGVYVLASSDIGEKSYSGPGSTDERPRPSVFTSAVIEVLGNGAAGTSASGYVSIDDLRGGRQRLLAADPPQRAVKSANRVSGAITIAARPLGKAPQPANVHEGISTVEPDEPDGVPTWPELLAYYSDIVRAEIGRPPLMDVRSASYIVVTERERALCGVLDDDGCVPLPLGADHLVRQASLDDATTLWMGWPAVVLYPSGPRGRSTNAQFAPLLIRQVEIVHFESGIRLRPDGPVMPHTGLVAAQLGEADADRLASTYLTSWHRGEYERMAHDAGHLMMNELGLPCIQELRPQLLEPTIDLATSGEGGRNCAVLFSITAQDHDTRGLLKDLEYIRAHPTDIERTALAALYPHSAEHAPDHPSSDAASEIVTPVLANPAQRAVIHRAIRRASPSSRVHQVRARASSWSTPWPPRSPPASGFS